MKKLLIAAAAICTVFSFSAFAEELETIQSDQYEYTLLEDGTAEIEKYNGFLLKLEVTP